MAKIYTKSGDSGETSNLGGQRISKDDLQTEATGALDELNAHLGLLHDSVTGPVATQTFLRGIQNTLFAIGSHIALSDDRDDIELPGITEQDVTALEEEIDSMQATLPALKNFILPGGHATVSICHIARSVSRRAERRVVSFAKESPVDQAILQYLNRLSDYLFVLARSFAAELGVEEIVWEKG